MHGKRKNYLKLTTLLLLFLLGTSLVPFTSRAETKDAKPADANGVKAAPEEDVEGKPVKGKEKELTLSIGVSRTLEFPFDIGPVFVTDPSLFEYRRIKEGDKERKLFLVPKNSGFTDMTVYDSNNVPKITYLTRVTREDIGQVVGQLEDLLGDIEGLKIRPVAGTVMLDGEILLPKDMVRIFRVTDAMGSRDAKGGKTIPIKNLATISKLTMNIIAERIEREIGSPEITARVVNNILFLEGTAEGTYEADRAVEIAKSYLPEAYVEKSKGTSEAGEVKPKSQGGIGGGVPVIIDLMRERPPAARPPGQDIKITMNYVELENDYEKSFNFQWQPLATDSSSLKYDTSIGQFSANLVATVSSLLPKLTAAKDHGHARVLKQEQIIVKDRSDVPATIESSIDLYASVTNPGGAGGGPQTSLQAIPVTNVTKVKAATIAGSDSIDLGIQISLNSLVGQNQGTPIIAKNRIETQITIKNGDSAALGGYAIDNSIADYNRAPQANGGAAAAGAGGSGGGASSTTGLFNFTRSKDFRHDKQQYVIFVTPEILRTASAGTEDITRKFRLNAGER